jgi:hypothetical protein
VETCLNVIGGLLIWTAAQTDVQVRTRDDRDRDIAFRNPAIGEHPGAIISGFNPKNPNAHYSIDVHVRQGSRLRTQYVSLTRSLDVARKWQSPSQPIYVVDLRKVQGQVIDLSIPAVRDSVMTDPIAKNFAAASEEVLVIGRVPPEAIITTIDFMQSYP